MAVLRKNRDFMHPVHLFFLLAVLALSANIAAQELAEPPHGIPNTDPIDYLPVNPATIVLWVFAFVLAIAAVSLLMGEKLSEKMKKIFFISIALVVGISTIYVAVSTVYLNVISESNGPIHWHADFEIWLCGQKVTNLESPAFPENKVGTPVFHHHDDYRIHVEGPVIKKENVSLGNFFEVIGGKMTKDSITVPLQGGEKLTYTNGMICPNGNPGTLKLYYMNQSTSGKFVESPLLDDYVLTPYFSTVVEGREGDLLIISFGTEQGEWNGS